MTQQAVTNISNNKIIAILDTTFDKEISIKRIACPLHVLELKNGLKAIESGSVLKINSNEHVVPELLAAARQIASSAYSNENHILFVTK